jgi:hypothetical protein
MKRTRVRLVFVDSACNLAIFVAFMIGCGAGARHASHAADAGPQVSSDSGTSQGGSGGAQSGAVDGGSTDAHVGIGRPADSGGDSAQVDASIADVGTEIKKVTLVDQPGDRSWQCSLARKPSVLGISPWQSKELVATSKALQLLRPEGGMPGPGGFSADRLVISSLGTDGVLGAPTMLGDDSGSKYGLPNVLDHAGLPRLIYSVASGSETLIEQVDLTAEGKPSGAPVRLPIDTAKYGFPMPLDEGYLWIGSVYDETRTDNGKLWAQKLDDAGKPVGDQHTIVVASAKQRMAELGFNGAIMQTDTGFLVLYGWFDATAQKVDVSHLRRRFQALDKEGQPVGAPYELAPEIGTHIDGNPQLMFHGGRVLLAWQEVERMSDATSPMGWRGQPLWSVIRVMTLDSTGMPTAPVGTVSPSRGSMIWPGGPYWIDLGADEVGLGWYEGKTDFAMCPSCWPVGTNKFIVLAGDLQSAQSDVESFSLQTEDAGFVADLGAPFGDDVLIVGDMAHNLWSEAASATLHCAH